MEEINKIPKIRFKNYNSNWKTYKVGDLLCERNEKTVKSDEYPLMAFIANEGVAPKGKRYDRSSLVTNTNTKLYKKTEYGDFIYSSNNLETGSIGLNKYGKACISPVYSIFYNTNLSDSSFIGHRLVMRDFIHEMVKWRQGVIYGQWKIHESDFAKIDIMVPKVDEQIKIGQFLDQIDKLIDIHQNKYEKLLKLKKSLTYKVFPQNKENIPHLRFKNYSKPWFATEFNQIFNYERPDKYIVKSSKYNNNALTPVLTANKSFILGYTDEKNTYKETNESIIFDDFTLDSKYVDFPYMVKSSAIKILTLKNNTINNLKFNYELLNNTKFNVIGHARHYISIVQPKSVYTTYKDEQDKISELFSKIDDLIELHHSKCEKLIFLKKGITNNIFI